MFSPEAQLKASEKRITALVEESCLALGRGDQRAALDKAKEASSKERSLIRQREQAGLNDAHNLDLTFSVSGVGVGRLKGGGREGVMETG